MSEDFTIDLSSCFVSMKGNLPFFLYESLYTVDASGILYPEIKNQFSNMVQEQLGRELHEDEQKFIDCILKVYSGFPGQVILSHLEQFIFWISKNPKMFSEPEYLND
jgi:hypothetical protein